MSDPIQFPGAGHVPILGQPARLLAFQPTVLLQCNCDGKHPLLAIGLGAVVACPGCKRRFTLKGFAWSQETGLQAQLGLVMTPEEAERQLVPAGSV